VFMVDHHLENYAHYITMSVHFHKHHDDALSTLLIQ
jgi:hypothetical protein